MFELKVVGAEEAAVLIGEGWPTRIVTLRAMSGDVVGAHHLYVVVDDVTSVTDERHPTPTHLHQVLDFTRDLTDTDRLLVHCKGGHSRSPAMAIAICMQHGMTYREAFAHVAAIRSALLPNQLFIQHIDEHFGLNGKLVELAKKHRRIALIKTRQDGGCCVWRAEPTLTKSDLIADLAARNPHLRVADVELIVAAIFDHITAALARGDRVQLRGFGAFRVKRRDAHIGRNPRTGQEVPVKEKTMPFFKAGKELRGRLNRRPIRPASEA